MATRATTARAGLVALSLAGALVTACAPSLDRIPDAPPPSGSAFPSPAAVADAGAPKKTTDGYVHVARRTHVTIGLAEAREIEEDDAKRLVDRLAEQFETCAVKLEGRGQLVAGAGRLIVLIDEQGHVTASDAKLSPGNDVAGAALLCLLAPGRGLTYPPGKGSRRGFAVEAVWEPTRS